MSDPLNRVLGPSEPELLCDECFEKLDEYVDLELAGKPALEKLRETIESLPPEDLRLVKGGLLMGIVVDSNKPDYVQGDFLVRGLVGASVAGQDQTQVDPCGREPTRWSRGVALGNLAGDLLPGRVTGPRQRGRGVAGELATV